MSDVCDACTCVCAWVHTFACESENECACWVQPGGTPLTGPGWAYSSQSQAESQGSARIHPLGMDLLRPSRPNKGLHSPLSSLPLCGPLLPSVPSPADSLSLPLDFLCVALGAPHKGLCETWHHTSCTHLQGCSTPGKAQPPGATGNNARSAPGLPESSLIRARPPSDLGPTLWATPGLWGSGFAYGIS